MWSVDSIHGLKRGKRGLSYNVCSTGGCVSPRRRGSDLVLFIPSPCAAPTPHFRDSSTSHNLSTDKPKPEYHDAQCSILYNTRRHDRTRLSRKSSSRI